MSKKPEQYSYHEIDKMNDPNCVINQNDAIEWIKMTDYLYDGTGRYRVLYFPSVILGDRTYKNPLRFRGVSFPFVLESEIGLTRQEAENSIYTVSNNCDTNTFVDYAELNRCIETKSSTHSLQYVNNDYKEAFPVDNVNITKIKKHPYLGRMFQLYKNNITYKVGYAIEPPEDSLYIVYSLLKIDISVSRGKTNSQKILFCYNIKTNNKICLSLADSKTKELLTTNDLNSIISSDLSLKKQRT